MSNTNIIIDEEVFQKAANDFEELSTYVTDLRKEVLDMLNDLKTGFNTPAGRKFYNSCANRLINPLNQQVIVLKHISENLLTAKNMYQSVFDEYREIVNFMKE